MAKKSTSAAARPRPPHEAGASARNGAPGRRYFLIGAALSFVISLGLYLKTMAPSASFWDCGEFIASSYTLGIPHSPGTPLYVLIGRVFTLLPLPLSIAGRVNFMSVVSGALGVLFVYLLVVRFLDHMLGKSETVSATLVKVTAAFSGAMFLTFSNTYWSNATEAEVYAMSAFMMGLMTWLGLRWAENPTGSHATAFIYFVFYLLALSVGLHLGTILAFAGIFFLVLMTRQKSFSNFDFLLACGGMAIFVFDATLYRAGNLTIGLLVIFAIVIIARYMQGKSVFAAVCTALFILGISVHLYLKIRSGHNPMIDEGDPENWRALYATLRREQYPPSNIFERKAPFSVQWWHFSDYFQAQFQLATSYVGKLNLGSVIPLGLGVWGMVDQWAKNRKTFIMLFVTFIVMSLGMIIYLNFSASEVRERDYFYLPTFYYFAVYIGIGAGSLLSEVKNFATQRQVPVVASMALPALMLVAMPLLTAKRHYWVHDRSQDRVCQVYSRNMLVGLEENALLFTNGDNDTFPLWYIQEVEKYRTDVRVLNLSLLNTPWYIKQLRDNEPRVNIQWSDDELYRLRPQRGPDGIIYVRDIAVRHILRHNAKDRPIYFAVTIPPDLYAPYRDIIEMEGLAYRVVPRKGKNMVNRELLEENIYNEYDYTGLLTENWETDTTLYHAPYVRRLIQNYAAAFTQLGFVTVRDDNDYCGGAKHLEVAAAISPNLDPVVNWLGWYYLECGDTTKAIDYYVEKSKEIDRPEMLYRLAGIYERIGQLQQGLQALDECTRRYPNFGDAFVSAMAICTQFEMWDQAISYANAWLNNHPNDRAMIQRRDQLIEKARSGGAAPSGQ